MHHGWGAMHHMQEDTQEEVERLERASKNGQLTRRLRVKGRVFPACGGSELTAEATFHSLQRVLLKVTM